MEEEIPLGKRKVVRGKHVFTYYRTADGADWISSRQAAMYANVSPTTMNVFIVKWEQADRLKRESISGNVLWIPIAILEAMILEIHSTRH